MKVVSLQPLKIADHRLPTDHMAAIRIVPMTIEPF